MMKEIRAQLWCPRSAVLMCAVIMVLVLASCGGSGVGNSDKSLGTTVNQTRARYQIMNLTNGQIEARGSVDDLISNPAYQSTHMVFRLVDVGSGTVGSTAAQLGALIDPAAASVTLGFFYLAVFETTQAQWQALTGPSGSTPWTGLSSANGSGDIPQGNNYPAMGISHDLASAAAANFRATRGAQLSLPSNTQWEIACRAGGSATWSWGSTSTSAEINAAAVVWENAGNTRGARTVGGRAANALGFYDLHGNVWELTSGNYIRGGSWNDPIANARAAHQAPIDPSTRHLLVGVRFVYQP
jgi:formylglycine-generating enzyme required for sulfatase activity